MSNKRDAAYHGSDDSNPAYATINGPYDHTKDPGAFTKPKRRIFMWSFLAVQALFLLWIIVGAASNAQESTNLTGTEADAYAVGTGIGVMLIIGLWMAVDFFMFIGWVVVRLSSRGRR